ncbi:MAG: phosphoribosylformylglycinamidine synthase subunit PurL [Planctomycetota bacterium]|nr:MAG: phosphoribosylformylglycinamidine synthase subunit PurL [Planctomycetota bacterium]
MLWEVDVLARDPATDHAARGVVAGLRELGVSDCTAARTAAGWLIEGPLSRGEVERIAVELLVDPITETFQILCLTGGPDGQQGTPSPDPHLPVVLHVLPKPGVTDPAAQSAMTAMGLLGLLPTAVRSVRKYWLPATVVADAEKLAWKLLASEAIHDVVVGGLPLRSLQGGRPWTFAQDAVPLDGLDDAALARLSRERCLALTAAELSAVRDHFLSIGRPPFEIELETIAQTWSEHCCHKTLGSPIDHEGPDGPVRYDNLLKETVFAATRKVRETLGPGDWCVSVFRDNSGVVRFDGDHDICIKVETHNHPSAIEPYGGAATGLGGVIRDVLGTGLGAKPIANLDVFCVGDPDTPAASLPPGVIPPRRLLAGVVAGVRDYGNRMGIPTIAGAVAFHPGYSCNPLVFCGTVGIMPRNSANGVVHKGDLVVVAGGRTGRDGIHGATFSSIELTSDSETQSGGSVQIGHAIHEQMLVEFILEASRQRLFHAITDCGAGGLSSAVGEMGVELGATVDLDSVPLKYDGLSATEVWISEAQERMVLAVAPSDWEKLARIAADEGVEATVIGTFSGSGRIELRWQQRVVGDIECHFLHDGRPRQRLVSRSVPVPQEPLSWSAEASDLSAILLAVLAAPDVASKEWIIRQYDHEVQGCSVVKPLLGPGEGPADATVIRGVLGRDRGIALGVGLRHRIGPHDPWQMAAGGIVEAVANVIATGADPDRIALLDNFCWGDTRRPESLGTLVEACRACHDVAVALSAPFVSGKDSLNNVFAWHDADGQARELSIPPTLLATAMGQVDDVRKVVTPDLKRVGSRLVVIGVSRDDLAGSQLEGLGIVRGGKVPAVDAAGCRSTFLAVARLLRSGDILACHDVSDGGLLAAIAEMAIGGGLGATIDLTGAPAILDATHGPHRDLAVAFGESPCRFVCEVSAAAVERIAGLLGDIPWGWIGDVTAAPLLAVRGRDGAASAQIPVERLRAAWRGQTPTH